MRRKPNFRVFFSLSKEGDTESTVKLVDFRCVSLSLGDNAARRAEINALSTR